MQLICERLFAHDWFRALNMYDIGGVSHACSETIALPFLS